MLLAGAEVVITGLLLPLDDSEFETELSCVNDTNGESVVSTVAALVLVTVRVG